MVSWNNVARQLITRNHLDTSDAARLYRDGKPRGGGRGHQHVEQQVPLQLLATVSQAIRRAADDDNSATLAHPLDAAHLRALPRLHVGTPGARRSHTTVLRMFFGNAPAGGYQIRSAA